MVRTAQSKRRRATPGPTNRQVVAVAYDGLCSFEFGVATELFGLPRPELGVDWYDFEVIAVDPPPLRTLGGVTIAASTDLGRLAQAGTIVIPGWRTPGEEPPEPVLDALRTAHTSGARLMSICSGVFLLAATGLLDGASATTHWRYTEQLAELHPRVDVQPDVLYVDNGSTLTSAGSAAGLDLGLHLIRRDYGSEIANMVARRLVVPPHRDGGQAQFITTPVAAEDSSSLAPTLAWATEHLAEPLTVAVLADHANQSARTFARRFRSEVGQTPHQWVIRQRVLLARQLLETTQRSIEEIAQVCGFGTAQTLRHHFAHETQLTPTQYRRQFASR